MASNGFEAAARARKVISLLSVIPHGDTVEANERAASLLAAMTPEDRAALAQAAGVRPPSDRTWAELVAAVRGRRGGDVFARVAS